MSDVTRSRTLEVRFHVWNTMFKPFLVLEQFPPTPKPLRTWTRRPDISLCLLLMVLHTWNCPQHGAGVAANHCGGAECCACSMTHCCDSLCEQCTRIKTQSEVMCWRTHVFAQRPASPRAWKWNLGVNKEKKAKNVGNRGEMRHWHPHLCGVPTKWQIISRLTLVHVQNCGLYRACNLKRPHQLVSCLLAVNIKCLRLCLVLTGCLAAGSAASPSHTAVAIRW